MPRLLLLLAAVGPSLAARRYMPPRTGLQIVDGPAAFDTALEYPCEYDETQTCRGMIHSEALFGIPKYGSSIQAYVYEVPTTANGGQYSDPAQTACEKTVPVQPHWASPFILIVNRGKCHFTEKVRNAARAGAVGVIVTDNTALIGEPLAYCADFTTPQYEDSRGVWHDCTDRSHGTVCKCGPSHNTDALLINSAPKCDGGAQPTYVPADQTSPYSCANDGNIASGACWRCPAAVGQGNEPTYYHADCFAGDVAENCQQEYLLPFMADDGDGGDITIPSFIVSDYNGALLRKAIAVQAAITPKPKRLQVRMAWDIKARKVVDYELWTSCEDSNGAEFKRDFQETALKLIDVAHFTPRYYIYDGIALQCNSVYDCGNQCISGGLYCGPDPDKNLAAGVSGSDVVNENLRQICIWEDLTSKVANGMPRTELMKWWCYVNDFGNSCFNEAGAMESSESFTKCGDDIMEAHDLDKIAIEACVRNSFVTGGGHNALLDQAVSDAKDYGVLKLPEAVVNGVVLRGQTEYGATLELNVAQAICNGFTQRPAVCEDIINPEGGLGQSGDAKVMFTATLRYVAMANQPGLSPTVGASATLQSRFRATLALKLGVDPQAIMIGDPSSDSATDHVVVDVQVNNLKCGGAGADAKRRLLSSGSGSVVDRLKKGVAVCSAEATTDEQVEDEVSRGQKFYFHTSNAHGSSNRQVEAKITAMSADESACPKSKSTSSAGDDGGAGGIGVGWVIVIALMSSGAVFSVIFLVYRHRARQQMRDEVKAILAEYMPLDDIPSGAIDSDRTRMLEGGGGGSSSGGGFVDNPGQLKGSI